MPARADLYGFSQTNGGLNMNITVMRFLRIKHGITLQELADAINVSVQYISDVELGYKSGNSLNMMQKAFESVISQRNKRFQELSADFCNNRDRLLDLSATEEDL